MKNISKFDDLLLKQVRNLYNADSQKQNAIERNMARVRTPEKKAVLEYSINLPDKDAHKIEITKLYIKNMVSIRCKIIVKAELEKLGLHPISVELGEVKIRESLSENKREQFKAALKATGLELLDDKRSIIVEKIRNIIVEFIHYSDDIPKIKISDYLSEKLFQHYSTLSRLFSEVRGTTIEHYIIAQKIERAKELIAYGELTLSEIAYKLHYSSVAHLSSQFKKITGLTPSFFKSLKNKKRIVLENL